MVYCGKPSKGCSNCRSRKISCDQREPGCGQCEKKGQKCPGYRNMVDLMFRDESDHVIKKANTARGRKGRQPKSTAASSQTSREDATTTSSGSSSAASTASPENFNPDPVSKANTTRPSYVPVDPPYSSFRNLALLTPNSANAKGYFNFNETPTSMEPDEQSLLPSPAEGTWPSTPFTAIFYSLSPSFQEQGTAFFFARYVTEAGIPSHQKYDYLYEIWKPLSLLPERQVDGVLAGMTAVGLVGLSNLTGNPHMMESARLSYGTALRLTNEAVMSPVNALKDTTLLSVLILGTYEMLTGRSSHTLRAWREHMNGAAALAKLRGKRQFRSNAGIRMFLMLCHTIMISCIQTDMPMPKGLIELRDDLGKILNPTDPAWHIAGPMYTALQIRYDIKTGKITDEAEVIDKLVAVEDEYARLVSDLPPSWEFRTVRLSRQSPAAFWMDCHVYPDSRTAISWASLRSTRMVVQETILGQLYKLFKRSEPGAVLERHRYQFARSKLLVERLRDAQIASIPQHFGVVSWRDAKDSYEPPSTMVMAKDSPYHVVSTPAVLSTTPQDPAPTSDSNNATVLDIMASSKAADDASERFMILASARNHVVWPLYLLGMSSSCTAEIKQYIVDRLNDVYKETGLRQAKTVAGMVQGKNVASPWKDD